MVSHEHVAFRARHVGLGAATGPAAIVTSALNGSLKTAGLTPAPDSSILTGPFFIPWKAIPGRMAEQSAGPGVAQNLVRFAHVLVCLTPTQDLELVAGAGGTHRLIALAG